MNKKKVENKARENVELWFMMESFCELLHLLVKVKMNGLYVLLLETEQDPEGTMNHLMKMETNMTLGNVFIFTFGKWYLWTLMNTFTLFWNEINLVRFYI